MSLYVLRNKMPVRAINLMTWAEYIEKANRRVADTTLHVELEGNVLDHVRVSTVFLGLDHCWDGGEPQLFETMIFGGLLDQGQARCATWEQAEALHEIAVQKVKNAHLNINQQLTIYIAETIK